MKRRAGNPMRPREGKVRLSAGIEKPRLGMHAVQRGDNLAMPDKLKCGIRLGQVE